jgi:hypothetical protein
LTLAQVLDYSAGFPGAGNIRGAGYAGAVRYIGFPDRRKCTNAGELADFSNNGIGMALIYQDGTGDFVGGFGAGQSNAGRARDHANGIGFPGSRPIYLAIDRDIVSAGDFNTVMSYLDGAGSVIGQDKVGVYGEHDVIQRALEGGHARYGWQTAAWSGGRHYPGAHLYQRIGTVQVGGVACDVNDVLADDWGQHTMEGTLTPDQERQLLDDVRETRRLIEAFNAGATGDLPPERRSIATWAAELRQSQAITEGTTARIMEMVTGLTDDEANIIKAIRDATGQQPPPPPPAPAAGQPATNGQLDTLAAGLIASLGPDRAAELAALLPKKPA